MEYDFGGWATRNDIKCSDGRIIRKNAFRNNDGQIVPLVWNHSHNDPHNVLGHALLENRNDGVYAYGVFNDTESGRIAKNLVLHGDVDKLSIYANQLKQKGGEVLHGNIRELSLVLSGANIGAYIDDVVQHSDDDSEFEATIYLDQDIVMHSDEKEDGEKEDTNDEKNKGEGKMVKKEEKTEKEKTVQDVLDELTDEQRDVIYALIEEALDTNIDENENENEGDDGDMTHNVFDKDEQNSQGVLSHSEMETIISDGKRYGSLKESFLAHAGEYGIENIDYLFPDAANVENVPGFLQRDTGWVQKVMMSVHHTPFSRIKSTFADITADEARAMGYMKGKLKKEEVFTLLKRTTTPTTIYKKQKLDRDDIVDITDFDVVAWLKGEMRTLLDEEIARAILIGDGRLSDSDDKINETNIRPIATDAEVYNTTVNVDGAIDGDGTLLPANIIKAAVKAKKEYKGSGSPTLFTSEDFVTEALLLEDGIGHRLYKNEAELAQAMRVKEIVPVPVMENHMIGGKKCAGIIVNLADYNVGADKGGEINMFDDFDIDYNQMKYLIETRCSGALVKPKSAITLLLNKE